jgi:hypothetical protein
LGVDHNKNSRSPSEFDRSKSVTAHIPRATIVDMKSPMKWWLRATLISVVLMALCIGGGIYLTEVALKGQLTPEKDKVISETIGQVFGFGVGGVWVLCFVFRKKSQPPPLG